MDELEKLPTVDQQYMAQLTAAVVRGYVKNPRLVRDTHFILQRRQKPAAVKSTTKLSKSFWLGLLGLKKKEGTKQ